MQSAVAPPLSTSCDPHLDPSLFFFFFFFSLYLVGPRDKPPSCWLYVAVSAFCAQYPFACSLYTPHSGPHPSVDHCSHYISRYCSANRLMSPRVYLKNTLSFFHLAYPYDANLTRFFDSVSMRHPRSCTDSCHSALRSLLISSSKNAVRRRYWRDTCPWDRVHQRGTWNPSPHHPLIPRRPCLYCSLKPLFTLPHTVHGRIGVFSFFVQLLATFCSFPRNSRIVAGRGRNGPRGETFLKVGLFLASGKKGFVFFY